MNILVPKNVYLLDDGCQKDDKNDLYICSLKKYSRAAGERSQVKKVEDMMWKKQESLPVSSRVFSSPYVCNVIIVLTFSFLPLNFDRLEKETDLLSDPSLCSSSNMAIIRTILSQSTPKHHTWA